MQQVSEKVPKVISTVVHAKRGRILLPGSCTSVAHSTYILGVAKSCQKNVPKSVQKWAKKV
jgi:hypothetical protein